MRIDKFLKTARILKRRAVANDACGIGRVSVNGKTVKPAYRVKPGDVVSVELGSRTVTLRITAVKDNATKEEATDLYEVISDK